MMKLFIEEFSKLPPPSVGPDIKAQVKSDKQAQIVKLLKSVPLEFKAKQLPEKYLNWPSGRWQNGKIRVDNIPASVADCWSCAIAGLVQLEGCFEDGSNRYAFLNFDFHHNAKRFVERFNKKQIPGTDMVYQLSWAPFKYTPFEDEDENEDDDAEEEKRDEDAEAQCVPVSADLCSEIRAFHGQLYDKAASCVDLRLPMTLGRVEMAYPFDDGHTTMLCLAMVDPGLERGTLEGIFGKYGECTVHLPPYPRGYGFVKFAKRESAEVALAELATLLEDEHVCVLGRGWCTDLKRKLLWCKEREKNPEILLGIERRLKRVEEQESLRLCGEEEDATVTTKMSKGRDGEEDATVTTKMSKGRIRARNCASKAIRGAGNCN